jgi:hypothetical protein
MLHVVQTWLGATALGTVVSGTVWAKALLESTHILADALILFCGGTIAARLLARAPAREAVRRYLPWLWSGLAVAVLTGVILLTGAGRRGLDNPMFLIKLAALAGAVLSTAAIQFWSSQDPVLQGGGRWRGIAVALVGPLGFLLWLATVFAGRLLAYSSTFFAPQY